MSALILALLEDEVNANQVTKCLEAYGHEVFVVDTFAVAINYLDTHKIDLILSDVHLENGGNVFDFLRRVKKDTKTNHIQFVLYSLGPTPLAKYLSDGVRTSARYLGAVKYIEMKTFDAVDFSGQINDLLPRKDKPVEPVVESEQASKIGE
jgi:CheY-like chemotaxis protein